MKKYLSEVVQRQRENRLGEERTLEKTVEKYKRDYETATKTLREMEKTYGVSTSDAAQLRKRLAEERLAELLAQRSKIATQQQDGKIQLGWPRPRRRLMLRPMAPPQPDKALLPRLKTQQDVLEKLYVDADANVAKQAHELGEMDTFNATVAGMQDDIRSRQEMVGQLSRQLDLMRVDAPRRVHRVVGRSHAGQPRGDAVHNNALLSVAVAVGLTFCLFGLTLMARDRTLNAARRGSKID